MGAKRRTIEQFEEQFELFEQMGQSNNEWGNRTGDRTYGLERVGVSGWGLAGGAGSSAPEAGAK